MDLENVVYILYSLIYTEIKATEFDIAIDIINKIAPKLREPGIDSDIVVQEICEFKQMIKDQSIEVLGNLTIQSGTYVINKEEILEMQTKHIQDPNLSSDPDDCLVPKITKVPYLNQVKDQAQLQLLFQTIPKKRIRLSSSSINSYKINILRSVSNLYISLPCVPGTFVYIFIIIIKL